MSIHVRGNIMAGYFGYSMSNNAVEEKWECTFLEWSGTRKHPTAKAITEIGIVKGNWFYRFNGTKKSIYANGFEFVRKIED